MWVGATTYYCYYIYTYGYTYSLLSSFVISILGLDTYIYGSYCYYYDRIYTYCGIYTDDTDDSDDYGYIYYIYYIYTDDYTCGYTDDYTDDYTDPYYAYYYYPYNIYTSWCFCYWSCIKDYSGSTTGYTYSTVYSWFMIPVF